MQVLCSSINLDLASFQLCLSFGGNSYRNYWPIAIVQWVEIQPVRRDGVDINQRKRGKIMIGNL